MKKILYSVFALAMAAFTLTSCEDVPAPYDDPNNNGGGIITPETPEPTGDGTLDNPFNAAAANEFAAQLESGQESDRDVYIKGKISSIKENYTAQFGNASFYISDDGTTNGQFYVYRAMYFNNKKYTEGGVQPAIGDEVIICGRVTNYMGNTYETVQNKSYLYSLNGQTGGGDQPGGITGTPTGDGTQANPFNSVAALQYTSALPADVNSDKEIYIKGKISSIKENYTTQFGNASFYISDDGTSTNEFYIFRTLYLGNVKYTEGDLPHVGDEVVICGKVVNYYGNTPETVANESYMVSLKSNGGGGSQGDMNAPNGDFEAWVDGMPNNWKSTSTAGNASLSQSTDAHGGKYSVNVGGTPSGNKRISYKELDLKAGEYTMTFYAKAATAAGASVNPGYVQVTDGKVGSYNYGGYSDQLTNTEWVKITHTFTIAADGTYCVVIMNSKNPGADVLIDDFTLTCGSTVIVK